MTTKTLLAASAAVSMLAAAGVTHATTVDNVTVTGANVAAPGTPPIATITGSGTGQLNAAGTTFTVNLNEIVNASADNLGIADTTETDTFTGTTTGGVFTTNGGSLVLNTCINDVTLCALLAPGPLVTLFNSASGSVNAAGNGNLTAAFTLGGTVTNAYKVSAASPVPLPPAVWLFGSSLLGLVGISRRHLAGRTA